MDHDSPEPLRSYHRVGCNEPVPLYRGRAGLAWADGTRHACSNLHVGIEWLPAPRVAVRAEVEAPHVPWSDRHVTVELPLSANAPLAFEARMVASSEGERANTAAVEFVAVEPVVLAPPQPPTAAWAMVHLVNCHDFLGNASTTERLEGQRSHHRSRTIVKNSAWVAVLDATPRAQQLLREAMLRSGYALTHVARLEAQGRELTPSLAQELARDLADFLSLTTGSAVGAFGISGHDEEGREIWAAWDRPDTQPYEGSFCPLPRAYEQAGGFGPPDLSQLSERYLAIAQEEPNSVARLRRWYLGALHAEPATSLMFAAAGLELLTHRHLVGEQGLTPTGFDRLSPADRLRLLLAPTGASTAIPKTLPNLLALITARSHSKQEADGPWCVTDFRNGVAHPPTRARREHADEPGLLAEASWLALWYLDLAVLRLLQYNGAYKDRTTAGHPVRIVPWADGREHRIVSAVP